MHQKILKDTFTRRNPIMVYNNHADFQQTRAISGLIGTGTGGVTEGLKNRVVMPVAHTLSQTDHVLGHELVHAFQFHMLTGSDTHRVSFNNLPLWMIEGMAEYLSIGSIDPNTSMWMRDALLNKDFPSLKDLNRESRYFPYRYGQAFWATVGKTWGDSVVMPLFMETARSGYDKALVKLLGVNEKTFSNMWLSAMHVHYDDYLTDTVNRPVGKEILNKENAGRINISPAMSPDGRYIAFISEKDLFTLDLFLYDIRKGKIVKKLASTARQGEIDDFNFMESAGTWSPDGRKFAFVIFSGGRSRLAILDVGKGRITGEIDLGPLTSFINPAWSPDGKYIVVSGLKEGISDLYMYEFITGKLERITHDYMSNIHPSWSSDGRYIAFSAERINPERGRKKYAFDIAVYELATGSVRTLNVFPGADNLNPLFAADNRSLYFLSDRDGFRNLYNIDLSSGEVCRLTGLMTGISGITAYSPAVSMSPGSGQLVYSYYYDNAYRICMAETLEFARIEVDPGVINMEAGTLPPLHHVSANLVDTVLYNRGHLLDSVPLPVREVAYRPRFTIDHISNVSAGVTTGRFGTGMAGSVNMYFSDITGNNQLYASLAANGEIFDFGGQVAYINTGNRINWGTALSHIPYTAGYQGYKRDSIYIGDVQYPVHNFTIDLVRMFEEKISLFSYYPFSQTRRVEAGASMAWYSYRVDRYSNYYSEEMYMIGQKKEEMPAPDGFNLQKIDLAYVEDNSYFGLTSPMQGHRSRVQAEKYFGVLGFYTGLVDYRKYFYLKPVNLSFRLYHYGRYGKDAESNFISPLFIGYPWLVRGYESGSLYHGPPADMSVVGLDQLTGSRILVGNAELRFPLSGPERLALIRSKWVFADFNLFFDAGLAWNSQHSPSLKWRAGSPSERIPVCSAGPSLRINLFGYLVIEPFYAFPFQNGGLKNGVFGINFTPGW
jgi:Tol biopolymer transport system component